MRSRGFTLFQILQQNKWKSNHVQVAWAEQFPAFICTTGHNTARRKQARQPKWSFNVCSIIRLNQVEIYCFALGDSLVCTELCFRPNYQLCYLIWSRICIMFLFKICILMNRGGQERRRRCSKHLTITVPVSPTHTHSKSLSLCLTHTHTHTHTQPPSSVEFRVFPQRSGNNREQ